MLEGKALVMAIMLLTASPLVIANEDTQILGDGTTIGDLREGLVTSFDRSDDALNKEASTSVDKKERDGLSDEDCLTIEEWREKSEKDWDRENWSDEDKKNGSRDDWGRENWSDEDKKNWSRDDWGRENWSDKEREERDGDEACLTMEEWKERFGRDNESRDKEDRKGHGDKEWEEIRAMMAELEEACGEGDEVACEKLESLIRGCGRERDDRDDKDRDEEDNEGREDSDEETEE
jgi:hypothetical protein